jgi:RNA polymerase-binding transcription factor DksA
VTDIVDQAQVREEMDRDIAIAAVQKRIAEAFAPRDPNAANWCMDCDGAIEPERLRVIPNTARCASCAHDYERGIRGG